jgi:hypothetical protein
MTSGDDRYVRQFQAVRAIMFEARRAASDRVMKGATHAVRLKATEDLCHFHDLIETIDRAIGDEKKQQSDQARQSPGGPHEPHAGPTAGAGHPYPEWLGMAHQRQASGVQPGL